MMPLLAWLLAVLASPTPQPTGTLLQSHPNVVPVAEVIAVVVAVVSFAWAAKFLPRKHRIVRPPRQERRVGQVESQVGTLRFCNPGRRSTDRCFMCPHNDRCVRYPRLQRSAAELVRDSQLVEAMKARQATIPPVGVVVIIEDQAAVMEVMCALLEQVGIKTRGAHSIAEALPFQLDDEVLVCDWNLPDGTGLDAVSAFHDSHPDGSVILTSAIDVRPSMAPTNAVWLPKPFDPDFFIALVRRMQAKKAENS